MKIALITGAAKRTGKFLAEKLANDGWFIAIHYNESEDEAIELAKNLLSITNVMLFRADLCNSKEVKNLIPQINKEFGQVSLVINNASIHKNDSLSNLTEENLETSLAVHSKAVIYLAQGLKDQEIQSDIINIIDTDVTKVTKDFFSYSLGKKTLLELTPMLALSLAPNTKVNGICPGAILFKDGQNLSLFKEHASSSPLARHASLDELYQTIRYLIETPSITGQIIYLDGGKHLNKL